MKQNEGLIFGAEGEQKQKWARRTTANPHAECVGERNKRKGSVGTQSRTPPLATPVFDLQCSYQEIVVCVMEDI